MNKSLWAFAAALFLSNAWGATYNYTAQAYSSVLNHTGPCATGDCQDYAGSMQLTISITTPTPLPGSLTGYDISAVATSYSVNDGVQTFASADPQVRLIFPFRVDTNAAGQITAVSTIIERWQTPGVSHAVGDRYDLANLFFGPTIAVQHNVRCMSVGTITVPDTCTGGTTELNNSSIASAPAGGTWTSNVPAPAAEPVSIPTLNEWGLLILSLALGLGSAAYLRHRRG